MLRGLSAGASFDANSTRPINFFHDKSEWDGTEAIECCGGCSGVWSKYVNESLRSCVATGKGLPTPDKSRRSRAKDRGDNTRTCLEFAAGSGHRARECSWVTETLHQERVPVVLKIAALPMSLLGGRQRSVSRALRTLTGLMAIVTVTAFNLAIVGRDDLNNVILVYLFAIAAVSVVLGYQPALVAATTSVVAFDYFFLVPYHSLMIANGRNVLTFAGMFVTAVFVSSLYERLREKARMARENEQRVETLYGLARALVDAATVDEVCERAVTQIEEGGLGSATIRVQVKDRLGQAICSPGAEASQGDDFAIAEWTAAHLEPAGAGAKHFPTAEARYVPLLAGRGCVGVLALRLSEAAIVTGASDGGVSLLDSMARQVAVAVDRALLAEGKERALIDAEMERIHNAVLSSISHDLRAPLGVIGAASSALVEGGLRLQGTTRSEMAQIIKDEAIRLNELLRSLFEVTRLQSGGFSVRREWESLEEIVGSALRRADQHRSRRTLRANVPSALPLVHLDAVLIEQVMLNLLDNAFKHSKSQQPVELDFAMRDSNVVVSVIDHGQGVRDEVLNRIFDKFYRSDRTSGAGLGLGLTIARGIVEAHGGRMWACHTRGGGLTVQFTLPVGEPAPGAPSVELPELASA